jgi:hypothetical protein
VGNGIGNDKPRDVSESISTLKWPGVAKGKFQGKDEIKRDTVEEKGVKSMRCFQKAPGVGEKKE